MILQLRQITRETEPSGFREVLRDKSNQPHIRATTPKDSAQRFASDETFDEWWDKGRVIESFYEGEELAAIIWFSYEHYNGQLLIPATFAIRIYEGYVGKGLGLEIMRRAHQDYFTQYPTDFVYLDVLADNEPAIRLYTKFGYEIIGEYGEGNDRHFTMIYDRRAHEVN